MSDYELHHGDMLEVMPTLAKGSVAMVFADLPYHAAKQLYWDSQPFALDEFWSRLKPIVAMNAPVIMTANLKFAARLLTSAIHHFPFRHDLVWRKANASNFFQVKRQPLSYHEHVLVFCCGKHVYNPQMMDDRKRPEKKNRAQITPYSSFFGKRSDRAVTYDRTGPVYPRSILDHCRGDTKRNALHPTQKPVALLEWLIATYTNPGDTVLDPCFGSGTTGVACARLGRKYIGIEKDAEYFRIGKERLEREVEALRTSPAQGRLAV